MNTERDDKDEAFGTDTAVYSNTDAEIDVEREAAGAEFDYRKKYYRNGKIYGTMDT